MKTIVIEGIGDVVSKKNGYGDALHKLKIGMREELEIFFCDLSGTWIDERTKRDRLGMVDRINSMNGRFLDKSDPIQLAQYDGLLHAKVDAVIIVTPDRFHISTAKHWLKGNCKRIYIEKPITNDDEEMQEWFNELVKNENDYSRVTAIDHYRPKVHSILFNLDYAVLLLREIGEIKKVKFYCLEDHSGTDKQYFERENVRRGYDIDDFNGAIENEGRVAALMDGIILDLVPHAFAVLFYFCEIEYIKIHAIRPAIYTGVGYDFNKKSEINGETFAAINISFPLHGAGKIDGEIYVGKGIFGTRDYPHMTGNVKVFKIEGEKGTAEFNFNDNTFKTSISPNSFLPLERDPYYYFLNHLIYMPAGAADVMGMEMIISAQILEKMKQMSSRIDKNAITTYELGNKFAEPKTYPPLLEDLIDKGGKYEVQPIILEPSS